MGRDVVIGTVVVTTAGSLLHFAWEWSGRCPVVAVFAAINESTWEHLKLAFWPAFFLAVVQRWVRGRLPGWLPATAIRCLLPSLLIVAIFHAYTAILGAHHLAADIALFVVAVFAGELAGHAVLQRRPSSGVRAAAAAALGIAVIAFSSLSFRPPRWFLFEEPGGAHGLPAAVSR